MSEPKIEDKIEKTEQKRALEIVLEMAGFHIDEEIIVPARLRSDGSGRIVGIRHGTVGRVTGVVYTKKYGRMAPGVKVEIPKPNPKYNEPPTTEEHIFSVEELFRFNEPLEFENISEHSYEVVRKSPFFKVCDWRDRRTDPVYMLDSRDKWKGVAEQFYRTLGHGSVEQIVDDLKAHGEEAIQGYTEFMNYLDRCVDNIDSDITQNHNTFDSSGSNYYERTLTEYRKAQLVLIKLRDCIKTALESYRDK